MKYVHIDWPDELGHYLRQARLKADLSLADLAGCTELAEDWLSRLEWGDQRSVPAPALARVVQTLGVDPMEVDGLTGSLIRDVRPGFRSYLLVRRRDRCKAALTHEVQRLRLSLARVRNRVQCGLTLTGALA